jgi:hypothetical protein
MTAKSATAAQQTAKGTARERDWVMFMTSLWRWKGRDVSRVGTRKKRLFRLLLATGVRKGLLQARPDRE